MYPALLPLMRTHRLPVVDCTDASADLNGLVRFVERRNLVSARDITFQKQSTFSLTGAIVASVPQFRALRVMVALPYRI